MENSVLRVGILEAKELVVKSNYLYLIATVGLHSRATKRIEGTAMPIWNEELGLYVAPATFIAIY